MTTPRPPGPRYSPGSPFRDTPTPPSEEYTRGDRVTHDKFGLGTVIATESAAVLVDFGAVRCRVVAPYTRLTRL